MNRILPGLAVVLATAFVVAPTRAAACGNEVVFETREEVRLLARAERLLGNERPAAAFAIASRSYETLRTGQPEEVEYGEVTGRAAARYEAMHVELTARALRIAALATVRRNGSVDLERHRSVRTIDEAARLENLRWARDALAEQLAASGDDPALRAAHAEALALFPRTVDTAREALAELHRDDLMPDHHGYRLLAELSAEAGDATLRDEAWERCRERAGNRHRRFCPAV